MNINEITENIYVINLKDRTDRKTHIESELKKINCEKYKLIEGINGNTINNPSRLRNGMFGLINTYLKIYEDWSKNDCDDIMIIEDD